MATVRFLGAAQEVTGSCHLLESADLGRVLMDCGMHKGGNNLERLSQEKFQFDPAQVDALLLSHAHIDHSGLLPKLVHEGFNGPIYCTSATAELLDIMLHDSGGLYQRDLERQNLQLKRRGKKPIKPLYTEHDIKKVLKLCRPKAYGHSFELGASASACFHDAGHILGSAIVEVGLQENEQQKTLVFSGDLGNDHAVLMNDPATLTDANVVMMEGTYGNRDHRSMAETVEQFCSVLQETWQRRGNVMIPAFAVGRTQEILFYLGKLHHEGRLDNWQVFLDRPMAISVTHLYDRWLHTLDVEGIKKLSSDDASLLQDFLPRLNLTASPEESMAINRIRHGAIIIAGSGMCTGGRIRHHFKQRIWDKCNTIIFSGFQARGTLGRILVDGAHHIRMFNDEFAVKARIETLGGFSAHAGQSQLLQWIGNFRNQPRVVLVHGEPEALDALSSKLWQDKQIRCEIPARGESLAF